MNEKFDYYLVVKWDFLDKPVAYHDVVAAGWEMWDNFFDFLPDSREGILSHIVEHYFTRDYPYRYEIIDIGKTVYDDDDWIPWI